MDFFCSLLFCLSQLLHQGFGNPLASPPPPNTVPYSLPKDFCYLPPELGGPIGSMEYTEDCESLDQFPSLPLPAPFSQKVGIHSLVCCPKGRYKEPICSPTDAWCSTSEYRVHHIHTYIPKTNESEDSYEDDNHEDIKIVEQSPVMTDEKCYNTSIGDGITLDTCVKVDQCPGLLEFAPTNAPKLVMKPCGFDAQDKTLMICCPKVMIKEDTGLNKKPRFPLASGAARECTDLHRLCPKWKSNDGCALDKDFELSKDPNGHVSSKGMFDFMQDTCLGSCGWCGNKGCVDELPDCVIWARNGMCVVKPFFMAHTCRESCGVCGFLSPFNNEDQVVNKDSYSDFTKDNFDCGRFKPLTEVNSEKDVKEDEETQTEEPRNKRDLPEHVDDFNNQTDEFDLKQTLVSENLFFSSQGLQSPEGGKPDYFCGATIISDRWAVTAAHCYEPSDNEDGGTRVVKVNTIRSNTDHKEIIEVKKIFKHPLFKFPNVYNDVAVLELGRRIEYNWDIFGDSPSCLDRGFFDKPSKQAKVQGFGLTEDGTSGKLLEAKVTIITNSMCKEIIEHNMTVTKNNNTQNLMKKALPQGLNYGLMCTHGEMTEDGVFPGPCKGDGGGPLTTENTDDRTTLVGIVSGGIGCGLGYPSWYTRVDFYVDWIECIIQTSGPKWADFGQGMSQAQIQKSCQHAVRNPKKCGELTEEDILFGDLNPTGEEDHCGGKSEDEIQYGGLTMNDINVDEF